MSIFVDEAINPKTGKPQLVLLSGSHTSWTLPQMLSNLERSESENKNNDRKTTPSVWEPDTNHKTPIY